MARHPTELLRLLAKHYPLVSAMCRENRRFASDAELESFCLSFLESGASAAMLVGRLKDVGVVSQTTGDWAPPPFLRLFLGEIEQRHSLASPGVVRGWIEKLAGLADRLEPLAARGPRPGLDEDGEILAVLDEITDTLSSISATVAGNCDRIGAEVSRYRVEEDVRQMRLRLTRLIDLHANYLEPVLRLIDIGGDFHSVSERTAASCAVLAAGPDSSVSFAAATVARDVVWLRRGTLRRAHEANRELGPLCEAAARESSIARGVNRALDAIANGNWEALALDSNLQVVIAPDGALISGRAAGAFMITASAYREEPPPLLDAGDPSLMDLPWSAATLLEELESQAEVPDLLEWICEHVGRDVADMPAGLMHDLIEAAPDSFAAGEMHRSYAFAELDLDARVWAWRGQADV